MKWLGSLLRSRRASDQVAASEASTRAPAGIDYLLAHAGVVEAGRSRQALDGAVSWEILKEQAEHAQQREDWTSAEALWAEMRTAFPHLWHSYVGSATALIGLGRRDEARAILLDAANRFPGEGAIRLALGHLAMRVADWPVAEAHWRGALALGVRPWWVFTELAGALERQGQLQEAEAVIAEGQREDPKEVTLFTYHARLAWKREDWSAAVARWAAARNRFPITEEISSGLYQALMRLAEHDPAAADREHSELGLASPGTGQAAAADDLRTLLLRFESLGGSGPDGGCEFGGVQREHGGEPLGLFRWATVTPQHLIACLEGRFQGIGEAGTTTVYLHDDDKDALWQIGDTTYGTSMHSFVPSSEVPQERMLVLARKRMSYLKDKLIADLEHPAKIFVLKLADRHLTTAETQALGRAIRSYGPGELLCVCPADEAHSEGRIAAAAPGLFVGYIDFAGRPDVVQRHAVWEALCRTMLSISALSPAE
jgi:tetratricopeptide (TPR) repeat protein